MDNRNSTDFPLTLSTGLSKLLLSWNPSGFLKKHQFIPIQYVMNNKSLRGLHVIHGMGRGKTILAAAIAWYLSNQYPKYKIIILASLTLEDNFKSNARKLLRTSGIPDDQIEKFIENYHFIPLNSGVMFRKIAKVGKSEEQLQFEDQLGGLMAKLESSAGFLENTILIIDEAHHFFNSVTNGSANAVALYDKIRSTERIKIFPLTGTPIIKHPFAMAVCYNMIGSPPGGLPLLPETLYEFTNMFIDVATNSPKNPDIFTNRIMGLTTYYGSIYEEGRPEGFAEMKPIEIRKVPMSSYQWSLYALARSREKDALSSKFKRKQASKERFGRVDVTSTYRVASRQLCNFAFPEHAITEEQVLGQDGLARTKLSNEVSLLNERDLSGAALKRYSPKMNEILHEIEKAMVAGEKKILIYSSFVESGINVFARILETAGWIESKSVTPVQEGKYFVRVTGEVEPEDRDAARDAFNSKPQVHIAMISGTGTEGLSLFRGRLVCIMEPFWYYERTSQAIHRFYRYKGHDDLPVEEQTLRVVVFLSCVPTEHTGLDLSARDAETGLPLISQPTTDEHLWNESMKGKELNDAFVQLLVESSIDCSVHYPYLPETVRKRIKCKMCAPTHKPLYNENVYDDFKYANPCKPISESNISAKEIIADGVKYYYSFQKGTDEGNKLRIFMYDPRISGYVDMLADHPNYSILHSKIMDIELPMNDTS